VRVVIAAPFQESVPAGDSCEWIDERDDAAAGNRVSDALRCASTPGPIPAAVKILDVQQVKTDAGGLAHHRSREIVESFSNREHAPVFVRHGALLFGTSGERFTRIA